MRVLIVVPTYNERDNILLLLRRIHELHPEMHLLIVDDASPDGTAGLVRQYMRDNRTVFLLEREGKLGLGTAYVAGFGFGISRGYDALIQMDCDFSHSPDALSRFVQLIGENDVVIGSRYVPGGSVADWNWFRRTLSRTANAYSRTVLGVAIRDLTGGFNAYRTEALKRLGYDRVTSVGYAFQIEMKYRACLAGLRCTEFPITFIDRSRGVSKIPRGEVISAFLRVLRWRLQPPEIADR